MGQQRPRDVVHHSDQGCRYTFPAFGKRCGEVGVRFPMDDAHDKVMAESFSSTLEAEPLSRRRFTS